MKHEYDTARPYVASYVILRQAEKIAFVLRGRGWMEGHWGLISGKKEEGEPNSRTAIREAEEEAGIIIQPQDLKLVLVMDRHEPSSGQIWQDYFWEAERWEGEIHNAEPEAHKDLAFFAADERPENMVPSVDAALKAIERGESYLEYGWKEEHA